MKMCRVAFRIGVEDDYYIEWDNGWWFRDPGGWLLCRIKYCPFCGAELNQHPYKEDYANSS